MRPEPLTGFAPDRDADALNVRFAGARAEAILAGALDLFAGRVALVSSFGADSAVLLHMASRIDPAVPVLMIDTQMLFPQTLDYQLELSALLGLTGVRRIGPEAETLRRRDPYAALHVSDPDRCCRIRKVEPLERALDGFDAAISGRKRYQTGRRSAMPVFETDPGGRIRVNPLAAWRPRDVAGYIDRHGLPRHPMAAHGYPSIGCVPCTSRVENGEHPRAGRWRGLDKDECGIHFGADGTVEGGAS